MGTSLVGDKLLPHPARRKIFNSILRGRATT